MSAFFELKYLDPLMDPNQGKNKMIKTHMKCLNTGLFFSLTKVLSVECLTA